MDYFYEGTINKEGAFLVLETKLYHTESLKILAARTQKGDNIFTLVDQAVLQLKKDLDLPKGHLDKFQDLPLAESLSNSIAAVRTFSEGVYLLVTEKNWDKVQQLLEKAVEIDPNFAAAQAQLIMVYMLNNKSDKLESQFQKIFKISYKLPERHNHYLRFAYYSVKSMPDKSLAVLTLIQKLYPDDPMAFSIEGLLQQSVGKNQQAIDAYKKVLDIDPRQTEVHAALGRLYEKIGQLEESSRHFTIYLENSPQDADAAITVGSFYKRSGQLEKASEFFQKALALQVNNAKVIKALAEIESDSGRFDNAQRQLEEGLPIVPAADKKIILRALVKLNQLRGRMQEGLRYIKLLCQDFAETQNPFFAGIMKMSSIEDYIVAGRIDEARQVVEELKETFKPPFDYWVKMGQMAVYMECKDIENIKKMLPVIENVYQTTKQPLFNSVLYRAQAGIAEAEGDYQKATELYLLQMKIIPNYTHIHIARCYRKLKQWDQALEHIELCLKDQPMDAEAQVELFHLYDQQGKKEKALTHLTLAGKIWQDADQKYEPAQWVKKKLAESSGNQSPEGTTSEKN